ncbi:two-component sensor histidine kinase [Streptomyces longisporoflavus]|uniref:sensor histidine kinase n=1 Tax=Streptomyces longisporoflavus TaxID=28044 RepID=UPI00167E7D5C|nr:sensor histidine kinase [Streptomyces longisporoflavus]GGV37792.1 two-component sensor histidine kinase [Streptomyces longisporoflavus]
MSSASTPPEPDRDPHRPATEPDGHRVTLQRAAAGVREGLGRAGSFLSTPSGQAEPLLARAPKRWMRLLPLVVALGFVAALIPVTVQVLTNDYGVDGGLAGALGVAQAAPLLLAVSRPLAAWCIMIVADVLGAIVTLSTGDDRPAPWTAMIVVGYVVVCLLLSLRESRRTLLGIWLVTVVVSLVLGAFRDEGSQDSSVLLIVLSGVALLLGALLRERGEQQRRLVEQETISEAERARRTLLEERARIARELHDVVAHHMSVITVQADSAPYRIDGLPEAAREEFGSIATSARESLTEMRRLLAVLRSEDTPGERAPQPGLSRLPHLVEATVRAGIPIDLSRPELSVLTQLADVTPAVDLSAYRIVQEALSNVMRHAPGAHTTITVTLDEEHLLILVVNGPPTGTPDTLEHGGTGHGLVGMRERVRLVGGTVDAGPLPDGGFRVAAQLPLIKKEPGTA